MVESWGSPHSLPQISFEKEQKSCRSEERCAAVLSGYVFVTAVHAPDSGNDLEEYEKCMEKMTIMLHEGRRAGASFYIASDLNIEFGVLCTGDDDVGGAQRDARSTVLARLRC